MSQSLPENDVITQACLWQARLSSDLVTDRQRKEFQHWLAGGLENKQAWQEVSSFWNGLDGVSEADISTETKFLNIKDVLDFDQNETIAFQPVDHQITQRSFFSRKNLSTPWLSLAACLLLTVTIFYTQANSLFADYKTVPGELATIKLSDGSQVILNSDSAVSVNYTEGERLLTLHRGEAYFEVASDRSHPFIVKTRNGRIQALGTEFDIKNRDDNIEVTVFEHAVSVSLRNGQVLGSLPEGKQLVFNDEIKAPTTANLSRTQSWRKHQIIFQDKPLVDVIAELNIYRSGAIFIVNRDIKHLSVTGIFDTKNTNIALNTIEQSLPVKINKITEQLVFISAK